MGMSHCRSCNTTFVSLTSFDMHRAGDYEKPIYEVKPNGTTTKKIVGRAPCTRRCMTEQEMRDAGMKQDERGRWNSGREMPAVWKKETEDDQDQPAAEEASA